MRVAVEAVRGEVGRYWHTAALMAASVACAVVFAVPVVMLRGRLELHPLRGGDLGLAWWAGVQPPAEIRQEAVDAIGVLLTGSAMGTLALAGVTILMLALVREAERAGEVSVRRAVGAGRRVLLSSALLEGALIVLAGSAVGQIVALVVWAGIPRWPEVLRAAMPEPVVYSLATLTLLVLAGVLFPVLFPRRKIAEVEPRSPVPLMPAALQMGAGLVALTMGATLARHAATAPGLRAEGQTDRALYAISLPDLTAAERSRRYAALLHAIGVESGHVQASLTSPGVLHGLGPVGTVTTDCGLCSEGSIQLRWRVKPATHRFVSPDTFLMLGVRVVEGRGITSRDTWAAPRVAVINRSLAAREFQDGRAVGRAIRVVDDGERWSTVVGVVEDRPAIGVGAGRQPHYSVFLSVLQYPPTAVDLLIGPDRNGAIRRAAVGALGPRAVHPAVGSERELVARESALLTWFAGQFALQGWAMLGIAAVGSLAMMRLWVSSLLVELGLRRALGAGRGRILGRVLLKAAAVGLIGIAGGAWFGQAIWGALASLVPGLDPWDAALVTRIGLLLMLSALLGALPPAIRAARAAPASLLSSS